MYEYRESLNSALEKSSFSELNRLLKSRKPEETETTISVYSLQNHTIDNIQTFLSAHLIQNGINLHFHQADYAVIEQELIDEVSDFHNGSHDLLLVSLVLETLVDGYWKNLFTVDSVIQRLDSIVNLAINSGKCPVVMNTFLMPSKSSRGMISLKTKGSLESKINAINSWLLKKAEDCSALYIIDWREIACQSNVTTCQSSKMWYMARALFTNAFLNSYAFEISQLLKVKIKGPKKCIALDCDGTLWGGVVGEDGLDGVALDSDSYPGRVFHDFQQRLLALHNRGFVLAVISKNNEPDVLEVFDKHPDMVLKREHFVSLKINWSNKPDNIEEIARDLNLSLDHFVFVDDSDFECGLMRSTYPNLDVFQVPKELWTYNDAFDSCRFFDVLSESSEDQNKTKMYQQEAHRQSAVKAFDNIY